MTQRLITSVDELEQHLGEELGVSDWITITQPMIDTFAQVTLDNQWIHVDPARAAKELPTRATIAHGFLTTSLISYLHASAIHVELPRGVAINYGMNRLRFPIPVTVNSRLRTHSVLKSVTRIDADTIQVEWLVTIEMEGAPKPACVAEWLVRFS